MATTLQKAGQSAFAQSQPQEQINKTTIDIRHEGTVVKTITVFFDGRNLARAGKFMKYLEELANAIYAETPKEKQEELLNALGNRVAIHNSDKFTIVILGKNDKTIASYTLKTEATKAAFAQAHKETINLRTAAMKTTQAGPLKKTTKTSTSSTPPPPTTPAAAPKAPSPSKSAAPVKKEEDYWYIKGAYSLPLDFTEWCETLGEIHADKTKPLSVQWMSYVIECMLKGYQGIDYLVSGLNHYVVMKPSSLILNDVGQFLPAFFIAIPIRMAINLGFFFPIAVTAGFFLFGSLVIGGTIDLGKWAFTTDPAAMRAKLVAKEEKYARAAKQARDEREAFDKSTSAGVTPAASSTSSSSGNSPALSPSSSGNLSSTSPARPSVPSFSSSAIDDEDDDNGSPRLLDKRLLKPKGGSSSLQVGTHSGSTSGTESDSDDDN